MAKSIDLGKKKCYNIVKKTEKGFLYLLIMKLY